MTSQQPINSHNSNGGSDSRSRIIAALLTLLIGGASVAAMLLLSLSFTANEPRKWPPVDTSELLLAGEYVMRGDIPAPVNSDSEAPAASSDAAEAYDDLPDSGTPAETPAQPILSEEESPAKVRPKPKPEETGPSREEREAQERERRQQEAAARINSKVNFSGTSSSKAGTGNAGSPSGNATEGALSGAPGFNMRGRTLDSWSKPTATAAGTITVTVRVDRQGRVIAASYQSGTGAVASLAAARRSCEQAALQSKFSVDLDATAEQIGTITYHFK